MKKNCKLFKFANCTNIVFLLSLFTTSVNAKLRDFETTRLMSTSGAGVGAILLNEAAILNPASIYFFKTSSFYYQQGSAKLEENSPDRSDDYTDGSNQLFLVTDTSSTLKGGFSYQTQKENGESRKRITSSASTNLGKSSSFGILYRYTEEDVESHKVYHQATLGYTYVYDKDLTFGAILVDPFLANKEDALAVGGLQYSVASSLLLMLDAGANYNDEPEKNTLARGALQARFFKNFYLKYGQFHNKIKGLEGTSWGLSWIGPRLALEYARKVSQALEDENQLFSGEEIVEHSFAASLVF